MGIDFGALIIELEALVSGSKEDFVNEFWGSYENYVETYNRLLKDVQSLGFYKQLKPIEEVPFSDQAFDSGYTRQEKAKLREVTNASGILLQKVKLLLAPPAKTRLNSQVRSNKIFLVHGQDNEMASDVIQTLQKLDLEPIVLQPDNRQDMIEKPSDCKHVSFAVVLLSPDEHVCPTDETSDAPEYRPAQDVIFELGYFLGRLGNQNVAAIYRKNKNFKIPNQHTGITWIEYKTSWYFELIRELKAANFDVDANKLGWL